MITLFKQERSIIHFVEVKVEQETVETEKETSEHQSKTCEISIMSE